MFIKVKTNEDMIAELRKIIENQKVRYNQLYDIKDRFEKALEDTGSVIASHKLKEIELKKEIEDLETKIDTLKSTLRSSNNTNQKMLIQIKHLRDQIDSLKISSKLIAEESEKLKMTLGTNYYDLTPRPNWGTLKTSYHIDQINRKGTLIR